MNLMKVTTRSLRKIKLKQMTKLQRNEPKDCEENRKSQELSERKMRQKREMMEMIRGKLVAVRMIMTMKMMNMKNHILLLEGSEMRWPQREIEGNTNLAKKVLVVEQMKKKKITKPTDRLGILRNKMPSSSMKIVTFRLNYENDYEFEF